MKIISAIIVIAICFYSLTSQAQKAPIKYGKISQKELELKEYEMDTEAPALILCDYGKSEFIDTKDYGFVEVFERITRIKILKKEGYEWARKEIFVKHLDEAISVEAVTFNLEEGIIVKTELENSNEYRMDYNKYWDVVKFEMPNIKVGSVIDIKYSIKSKSVNIRDWYFQYEIPTVLSQYNVSIPEYLTFAQVLKGYVLIKAANPETYNSSSGYEITEQVFVGKDIPAFKKEGFLSTIDNYRSVLEFDLQSYNFNDGRVRDVTETWIGLCNTLLFDSDFGSQLNSGNIFQEEISIIKKKYRTDEEKISAFLLLIQNNVKWNNYNSFHSNSISKAWKAKQGNSGDINLMLIAGLRSMGYDANPVLLSTREHGFLNPSQIMLNQFNYVLASVKFNDTIVLLDGTDRFLPFGFLPEYCLNGKGRIINQTGGEWIAINSNRRDEIVYETNFVISVNGSLKGEMKEVYKEFAAQHKRLDLEYFSKVDQYFDKYASNFVNIELSQGSITNLNDNTLPLSIEYQINGENLFIGNENLILFNPILCGRIIENPFKLEKRDYPVEYSVPYSVTYIANITLPDEYSVKELPKSFKINLTNNKAVFIHSIRLTGKKLQVVTSFNINDVLFLPAEYENLKEFYNIAIKAQSEQIVMEKL
jgi:hypothetical protein